MIAIVALAAGGSAVVAFVGYVGRSLLRSGRVKNAAIDAAWAEARTELGGTTSAVHERQIEYRARSGTLFLAHRKDAGQNGETFVLCVVSHVHKIVGAHLLVQRKTTLSILRRAFAEPTGDPAFDQQFWVAAKPAYLAHAFLDEPTRTLIRQSRSTLEGGDGWLRMRAEGEVYDPRPIVALARSAERIAERWNYMVAELLGLAGELGFERAASVLSLEARTLLGQAFRRGHTWRLELVPQKNACEIVLHTQDAPRVELRFPWPGATNREIASTFAATESALSADAAYR